MMKNADTDERAISNETQIDTLKQKCNIIITIMKKKTNKKTNGK